MKVLRIEYAITEEAAYLSHLETMKTFERAIRRAKVPIAYSEGFNPHPKIAIAAPLSVGVIGKHEFMDVELREEICPNAFLKNINANLPKGMEVINTKLVAKSKPLMAVINAASYRVELDADKILRATLKEAVTKFLEQPSVLYERKTQKGTKTIDVRKGVYSLKAAFSVISHDLEMLLTMGNEGNVRPDEVVRALMNFANEQLEEETILQVIRTGLYIYKDGQLISPMQFGSELIV